MTIAIRAEGLGKRYRIGVRSSYRDDYRTIRESLAGAIAGPLRRLRGRAAPAGDEIFWALRGVDFDVQAGEVVGIIGRNGAGKSTLLKVLSRITRPTTGRVELYGRVASLLEVGTGFHPELTGRENIYLNGSILGMKRSEIARKFDEIVAFADMERFLETPVKRYSSGMYVRLAFAVAAHLEPEILIVDEVLAVGDAEFQRRCLGKMGEVAQGGRTVLFVSHNMGAVQALCRSAILMDRGQVVRSGPASDVLAAYHEQGDRLVVMPLVERTDRRGQGTCRFHEVEAFDAQGRRRSLFATGEDLILKMTLFGHRDAGDRRSPLDVSAMIRDGHGHLVTTLSTSFTGSSPVPAEGRWEVSCLVPRLPLLEGRYRIDLRAATIAEEQDVITDAFTLNVGRGDYFDGAGDARLPSSAEHGVIVIPQSWSSQARPAAALGPEGS